MEIVAKRINEKTIRTGEVRLSYPKVFKPNEEHEYDPGKYTLSILIDKNDTDTIGLINELIMDAAERGKKELWKNSTVGVKTPLRDGDTERPESEECAGKFFLNAKTKNRPGVWTLDRMPITDEMAVYGGCWALVVLRAYPFEHAGNKGIAMSFEHVIKTKDDASFAGYVSVTEAFNDIEGVDIFDTDQDSMLG